MIANFDQAIEEIKGHLPEYLAEKGLSDNPKKNFLCPFHQERNPSCHLLPDLTAIYCHGCSTRADLLDLYPLLELDKKRQECSFVGEILTPLAEKYGVRLAHAEINDPGQEEEYRARRAYEAVGEFILKEGGGSPAAQEHASNRAWDPSIARLAGVGSVESWGAYLAHMAAHGYDEAMLKELGLYRPDMFKDSAIFFVTRDLRGKVVGIAARDLNWKEGEGSKYLNLANQPKAPYFNKGRHLFGIDRVIKSSDRKVYLFEGQASVITAACHGIQNCLAIGGTALTEEQVLLIREAGIVEVILCLDGDHSGQEAVGKILKDRISSAQGVSVRVMTLPDGMDPDDFLKVHGSEGWAKLATPTAFEWQLLKSLKEIGADDMETVAREMIPLIAIEPSYITREKMCKALARATGYSLSAVEGEVRRIASLEEGQAQAKKATILDRAFKQATKSPDDAEAILLSAQQALSRLSQDRLKDKVSAEECLRFLEGQRSREEEDGRESSSFVLGPNFRPLEEALDGEWTRDVLCMVGGRANAGKSSFMAALAYEIAKNNDATVIFLSIDDTLEQLLPKFVCVAAEGHRTGLTINQVRRGERGSCRLEGYRRLRQLMAEEKLVLKDANHGNGLSFVENLISHYRYRHPERKFAFVLDNFHKLPDFRGVMSDERVRFKALSEAVKGIATRNHVAFLCTVEYTKLIAGTRPSNTSISESGQMEYDANLIVHLYNELHELGRHADTYHLDHQGGRLPIVEATVSKNKISAFKGDLLFKFWPASSGFEPTTPEEIQALVGGDDSYPLDERQEQRFRSLA